MCPKMYFAKFQNNQVKVLHNYKDEITKKIFSHQEVGKKFMQIYKIYKYVMEFLIVIKNLHLNIFLLNTLSR